MMPTEANVPGGRTTRALRGGQTSRLPEGVAREAAPADGPARPLPVQLARSLAEFELEVLELTATAVERKVKEALGAEGELERDLLAWLRTFFADKRRAMRDRL